jgi:antitoxin YefM
MGRETGLKAAGDAMISVHEDELHQHLNERPDQVCDNQVPLLVQRRNGGSCVIVDKAEWDGLMTTIHLLNSPANAARLLR